MGLFSTILQVGGGILGSILGAKDNKEAIGDATDAQVRAAEMAIEEQRRQYDTSRSDFMPWLETGQEALGSMGDLLGLNGPEAAARAIAALKASPMFTSLFRTGEEAILQNASATGGLRGGNTQGALYEHGEDTLARLIERQLASLGGISGAGAGAAGSLGTLGSNMADQIGTSLGNIGAAQAGGILGKQNVNNQMVQQIQNIIARVVGGGGF
jgi:hypothetical protein